MKIKEIYVELGIKKSQNFNSCTNAVGLRGELEAEDDPVEMVKKLQRQCYALVLKQMPPVEAVQAKPAQGGSPQGSVENG
jgi:hypothetical protein